MNLKLTNSTESKEDQDRQFTLNFLGITGSNATFNWPEASGFLGILPYTKSIKNRYLNFVFQLKVQGIINHNVVSIYAGKPQTATVKFGSMDLAAIRDGQIKNMRVFRTTSLNSWRLQANKWLLGNVEWQSKRLIDIDPSLPYIYIPTSDWDLLRVQLQRMTDVCTHDYCMY
jgi:hypothetical protein